jgi:hypothetical protein
VIRVSNGVLVTGREDSRIANLVDEARHVLAPYMHSSWQSHSPLIVAEYLNTLREPEAPASQSQSRSQITLAEQSSTGTHHSPLGTSQEPSKPSPLDASQQTFSLQLPDIPPSNSSLLFQTRAPSPFLAMTEASITPQPSHAMTRETTGSSVHLATPVVIIISR